MIARQYQFQFFLNAKHDLSIDGKSSSHPHTWEIGLALVKESEEFEQFTALESVIKKHLDKYESKHLNNIEPFSTFPPTLEIIGEVLYMQLSEILETSNWKISSLEISETASRKYVIKDIGYRFRGFNPITQIDNSSISKNNEKKTIGFESNSITAAVSKFVQDESKLEEGLKTQVKIDYQDDLNLNKEPKPNEVSNPYENYEKNAISELREQLNSLQNILATQNHSQQKNIMELESKLIETNESLIGSSVVFDNNYKHEDTAMKQERFIKKRLTDDQQLKVRDNGESDTIKNKKLKSLFVITLMLIASFAVVIAWATKDGLYPWGSDTWGHLFKTHFLYKEVIKGNIFPKYTNLWYNGIQPFRYWAPFPYYLILIGELLTGGNSLVSFYIFVGIIYVVGSIPFIILGKSKGNIYLGTIIGIIYFILPDNYRLLFAEGNLPRVVVSMIFPYMVLMMFFYLEKPTNRKLVVLSALMFLITLTHAMIAALTGIIMFLFLLIRSIVTRRQYKESVYILISLLLGIVISGIWLYPALKGGIISIDSSSVMESLTYTINQMLNPFYRVTEHTDAYYFGLSVFIITCLGLFISKGQNKASFILVIIIFLGTTKWFLFALQKLPMSELFWMMRFTPMAMVFFLMGIINWKELKTKVMVAIILMILVDCIFTMAVVNASLPINRANQSIDFATHIATQRVAMMDLSTYDSDPSYFLSYSNSNSSIPQVFGWAWQGASTATKIVEINEAFVKGYYNFMFDELLELGSDTIIVRKKYIEDHERLVESAKLVGYKLVKEFSEDYVFKYDVNYCFGSKVEYEYLAIGKYSHNIIMAFPEIIAGNDIVFDHYNMDDLKKYKKILLTGFEYDDKLLAESMIKELAENGIEVIIDMTGQESDMYSMRPEFMDVIAQPLNIAGSYPVLDLDGSSYILDNFSKSTPRFNTFYLSNLDVENGTTKIDNQEMVFYGSKGNDNIKFVGLNLFYYLFSNHDETGLDLVSQMIGISKENLPKRDIVKVQINLKKNRLEINAEPGTLVPIAAIDAFESKQAIYEMDDLLLLIEGNTNIDINYPYLTFGGVISLVGLLALGFFIRYLSDLEKAFVMLVQKIKNIITS